MSVDEIMFMLQRILPGAEISKDQVLSLISVYDANNVQLFFFLVIARVAVCADGRLVGCARGSRRCSAMIRACARVGHANIALRPPEL